MDVGKQAQQVIDGSSLRIFGEGIGVGIGGFGTAMVAAVIGIPAIKDGLRQMRELVDRMDAAVDKLSDNLHGIDKRLTAVEVTNTLMLGIHHPDTLEKVTEGAAEVIEAREAAVTAGHPFRRATDHKPSEEKPAI